MHTRTKLVLGGLAAAMLLAFAIGTASANRLSVNEKTFLIRWSPLTLSDTLGDTIRCSVTLDGTFHENTIRKVEGTLIGAITSATVAGSSGSGREAACEGGTATVLRETLPWHVQYGGFSGTLPRITSVTLLLIGASFRVDPEGFNPACLAATEATHPARGIASLAAGGAITGLRAEEGAKIPLSGGFGCGVAEGFFSGTGTVQNERNTASLTVTLI